MWPPISSPKLNRGRLLREHRSAVLIQRRLKGSARKDGLLVDESSVSSLSTSESIREKGYHLPDAATIPSTVVVAKPFIKSNPVTQSFPRQRQAKRPTVDSPTITVLSPIKKRRILVEDSGKVEIAVTERKVCCPEDLLVSNGFKKSVFYTDRPCQVRDCKDPACVFGHTCKCFSHRTIGDVLKGECFSIFKNGDRTKSCLYKSRGDKNSTRKVAEVTSTKNFAFFKARTASFMSSTLHSWNNTPTPKQSEVFLLQVVINQARNPDTPFIVTETSSQTLEARLRMNLKPCLKFSRNNSSRYSRTERESHVSILGLKLFP